LLNGCVYFATNGNSSARTILPTELRPPLSTYNVEFVLLVTRLGFGF